MDLRKEDILNQAPSTRYQGSKRSVLPWIWKSIKDLKFDTALDAFGGTGSVSYLLKAMGKAVTFNDVLLSNYQTGIALIKNSQVLLNDEDTSFLLNNGGREKNFIEKTFRGIYFLNSENRWLDRVVHNIRKLRHRYSGRTLQAKRALAYHALFQACLRKRPFNLFHRKNLHLRTAEVERSFGNKTTWDTSFERLFRGFVSDTSERVFCNGRNNYALCKDIFDLEENNYDLVYLDPPYVRPRERRPKDYHALYHFLEGLVDYENWSKKIDWDTQHRRRKPPQNKWMSNTVEEDFTRVFEKFRNSIIVLSYGEPGVPSVKTIVKLLKDYKSRVVVRRRSYSYSLNRNNGKGLQEVLVIGT